MQLEHCTRDGCGTIIRTTNYNLVTTPRREWKLVLREEATSEVELRFGRRIPSYEQLGDLAIAKTARLTPPEIIAVVLYTGPMVSTQARSTRSAPAVICYPIAVGDLTG